MSRAVQRGKAAGEQVAPFFKQTGRPEAGDSASAAATPPNYGNVRTTHDRGRAPPRRVVQIARDTGGRDRGRGR